MQQKKIVGKSPGIWKMINTYHYMKGRKDGGKEEGRQQEGDKEGEKKERRADSCSPEKEDDL